MALVFGDRIKETTTTTGSGTLTLLGAVAGYKAFTSVMSVNDTCYYSITSDVSTAWEIGLGTLSDTDKLERTTLLKSSTGTKLSLEAGSKNVFLVLPQAHIDQLTILTHVIDGGTSTSTY